VHHKHTKMVRRGEAEVYIVCMREEQYIDVLVLHPDGKLVPIRNSPIDVKIESSHM
jgi:hypothetical protein